jgi:hypothetical protein
LCSFSQSVDIVNCIENNILRIGYHISLFMIVGAWNYIRLRGGISNYSGRVEVKIAGAWGQICGRYWSRNDAIVACRQLGFDGARNNSPKVKGF